jgi:hypothetical protein
VLRIKDGMDSSARVSVGRILILIGKFRMVEIKNKVKYLLAKIKCKYIARNNKTNKNVFYKTDIFYIRKENSQNKKNENN